MNWTALKDFVHQISVAVALFLILLTGLVVDVRLIQGHEFPGGYDTWIWALIALAGVNMAGIGVIRATGVPYAAAKAGAQPPGPAVNVQGDANINAAAPAVPQAGVKPTNPAVVAAVQSYADKQRAAISNPGEADD